MTFIFRPEVELFPYHQNVDNKNNCFSVNESIKSIDLHLFESHSNEVGVEILYI